MGRSNFPPCWKKAGPAAEQRRALLLPYKSATSPIFRSVEAADTTLRGKLFLVCAMLTQISPLHLDRLVLVGAAVLLLLNLSEGVWAAPTSSKLVSKMRNIELCNGSDRSSPEPQIRGCTALIND